MDLINTILKPITFKIINMIPFKSRKRFSNYRKRFHKKHKRHLLTCQRGKYIYLYLRHIENNKFKRKYYAKIHVDNYNTFWKL